MYIDKLCIRAILLFRIKVFIHFVILNLISKIGNKRRLNIVYNSTNANNCIIICEKYVIKSDCGILDIM
jgi:hypothetical protein